MNNDMIKQAKFLLTLSLISIALSAKAQVAAISVEGEVTRPLRLQASDLLQMKRAEATIKDREGIDHTYTGVPVTAILDSAGVTLGQQLRGENLSKYLLVKCADGYEVLFSLAELDTNFGDRTVILADQVDGKSLPQGRGPFRLIVPQDKALARNSFEVTTFIIGFAKD